MYYNYILGGALLFQKNLNFPPWITFWILLFELLKMKYTKFRLQYHLLHYLLLWFCWLVGLTSLLNIWGHITTVPACSSGTFTNELSQKCHAADTGHDTQPYHSIQTQGRPIVVLSIDVERHTGIHNYGTHFNVLGQTRSRNPSPNFHTHQRMHNSMMLIWW